MGAYRPLILAICTLPFAPQLAAKTDNSPCPPQETFDIAEEIDQTVGFPDLSHLDPPFDEGTFERVCSDRLCLDHDPRTKSAIYVAAKLNRSVVCGDNNRPKNWKVENRVKTDRVAQNAEYTSSGFARGHLAASADFQAKFEHMEDTFYFSNAVPQIQDGFNGSYWRYLEDYIQDLAMNGHEMIVITGPVPMPPDGKETVVTENQNACGIEIRLPGFQKHGKAKICDENDSDNNVAKECIPPTGVTIPAGMFKIVYQIDQDEAFAFLMGNYDHRETHKDKPLKDLDNNQYLELHRVSIDVIEKLTNIDFLTRQYSRREDIIEESCIATPWH
ncbi:DNA/RNA non-specific endonuclease [Ruegeria sp. Ofav3-42]|uniref:DNA/RNA non-specific endonuclease n=1 Tax=Ruegeria sp. Ofav3-42 TaxID=2917759 RepID=UPI001EF5B088|nr:DNA/RNA non-specific endonuclease [Ruegeria sp. Ofav3-42]MCG7521629.1 DNA/RNA non-specific endonuclease [Ruegeria sp. Ofav3-42]